jgi:hypothetical protein
MRALALLLVPLSALAHEGHGASAQLHLHPGEWFGLAALTAVAVVVLARFWKK